MLIYIFFAFCIVQYSINRHKLNIAPYGEKLLFNLSRDILEIKKEMWVSCFIFAINYEYGRPKLSDGIRSIRGMRSIAYVLQSIHYFLLVCYHILIGVHYYVSFTLCNV